MASTSGAGSGGMGGSVGGNAGTGGSASAAGAPSFGPKVFAGPPFVRPALPVRRLAVGDQLLCVVLQDRSIYCVERSAAPREFTNLVPNNHDYDEVDLVPNDGRYFHGFHRDRSVDTWQQRETSFKQHIADARYLAALADGSRICGLRDDGAVFCNRETTLVFPEGPLVDFTGTFKSELFVALRADGVILSSDGVLGGGRAFVAMLSYGTDSDHCGVTAAHELYCNEFRTSPNRIELKLIAEGPFRDIASGLGHRCYLAQDGRPACVGSTESPSSSIVPSDMRFVDIATASDYFTCGVEEDGDLWCWGRDMRAPDPVQIALPMKAAVD
jgi:hypothetical protein